MTAVLASVPDPATTPFGQYFVQAVVTLAWLAGYFTLIAVVWFTALARWQRRHRDDGPSDFPVDPVSTRAPKNRRVVHGHVIRRSPDDPRSPSHLRGWR